MLETESLWFPPSPAKHWIWWQTLQRIAYSQNVFAAASFNLEQMTVRQLHPLGSGTTQTPTSFPLPDYIGFLALTAGCTDCTLALAVESSATLQHMWFSQGSGTASHICHLHLSFDQCHHDGHGYRCGAGHRAASWSLPVSFRSLEIMGCLVFFRKCCTI